MSMMHSVDAGNPALDQIDVVHVDDDPQFGELTKAYLEEVAPIVDVTLLTSADEAVQYLTDHPVDCVLSDYDMPQMNGLELLETLRDRDCDLPFILFTGKGSEEIASEAISAGVSDYIQKSGGKEQYELLAKRVQNLVRKHQTERRIRQVYEAIDVVDQGISLLDDEGRFVYMNQQYAEILGYDPDELTRQHWTILYQNDSEIRTLEEDVLPNIPHSSSDRIWSGYTVKQRKDGTRVRTDHRLAQTSDGMMICLLSNPTDIAQSYDGPVAEAAEGAIQ